MKKACKGIDADFTGCDVDLLAQKRELERAKIQFRDERNAWQKQNYNAARVEQKLDYLESIICNESNTPFNVKLKECNNHKTAIICCSDWHIGESYDNEWGVYNSDIAKARLEKYCAEAIKICETGGISNVVILGMGDLCSGLIHTSIQVTNRENVIEQVMLASEYMRSFVEEFTKRGYATTFLNVAGNHTRIAKKDEAIKDDRLDNLVGWYVNTHLKRYSNFKYVECKESTLGEFEIFGNKFLVCHGDYDNFTKNGLSNLVLAKGYKPTAIFFGHFHTMAVDDIYDVKLVRSGSLGGSGNQYTIEKRLYGKPSQTIAIADENGVNAFYNIDLKETG